MLITFFCSIGHIASSLVIASPGILLGLSIEKLDFIENFRRNIAAWILIIFGFMYCSWGIVSIHRNKKHSHIHIHNSGIHSHQHNHHDAPINIHDDGKSITPWILFIIFIFGPCEPLISMVMYPVSQHHLLQAIIISLLFSITTIVTMLGYIPVRHRHSIFRIVIHERNVHFPETSFCQLQVEFEKQKLTNTPFIAIIV